MKVATLAASCLLAAPLRVAAFARPPASFFGPSTVACPRRYASSFPRPSSGDSSSSSSSSSDFSFNDLEREIKRRRAEEAMGAGRPPEEAAAEAAATAAAAAAAAAVAAASSPGLEEGDAFMEEQLVSR